MMAIPAYLRSLSGDHTYKNPWSAEERWLSCGENHYQNDAVKSTLVCWSLGRELGNYARAAVVYILSDADGVASNDREQDRSAV